MPTTTRRRASLAGSLPDDELSIAESHDSPKVSKGRKSLSAAGVDVDVMEQRRRALEWKEKFLQSQKLSEKAEEQEEVKAKAPAPVKRSTRGRTAKAVKEEKVDTEEVLKPRTRTRRGAVKEESRPVEDEGEGEVEDKENDDTSINSSNNPNSSLAEEGDEETTAVKSINKTPRKRLSLSTALAGTIAAVRTTRSKAANTSTETTEKVVQEEQVEQHQVPAATSPVKIASPLKTAAAATSSPSPSPAVVAHREDSPVKEASEDKIVSAVEGDSQQETEVTSSASEVVKEEVEEVVSESKTTEENLQVVPEVKESESSSFEMMVRLVVLLSITLVTFQDGNLGIQALLIALVIALCRRLVSFVL
eukprot:gene1203-1312_t